MGCSASTPASFPLTQRLTPGASGPLHALRIVYRATVTGGHLRNETDGSTDRAEWFPLESVRALHRVKLVDVGLRFAGIDHTDERRPPRAEPALDERYCSIDCEMSATVAPYAAIRSSASTNRL